MKIESLIKRDGGTVVQIGDIGYHFKDDGTGCHVCEVKDKTHAEKLLAIPEGYAEVKRTKPKTDE